MDDWDWDLFKDDLKRAVRKLHNDKCSKVETYIDCENKEYKVIIEEVEKEVKVLIPPKAKALGIFSTLL